MPCLLSGGGRARAQTQACSAAQTFLILGEERLLSAPPPSPTKQELMTPFRPRSSEDQLQGGRSFSPGL